MTTPQQQKTLLHPRPKPNNTIQNPLPQLLQTPSGLALLELQGTINLPDYDAAVAEAALQGYTDPSSVVDPFPIGRLDFPDYRDESSVMFDPKSTAWMKRVYMYVGEHQRLTGEVKKLPKAVAVVRRKRRGDEGEGDMEVDDDGEGKEGGEDDLEVVEIVKYKIVFSNRPEPVSRS